MKVHSLPLALVLALLGGALGRFVGLPVRPHGWRRHGCKHRFDASALISISGRA